jgi:hypothetical protein
MTLLSCVIMLTSLHQLKITEYPEYLMHLGVMVDFSSGIM